jgi:hypothetical protein
MQLSQHFSLEEVTKSQTGSRLGIANTPNAVHLANLKTLCAKVLEPVRAHYGKAVHINSGYRGPALNKTVGGAATSQHCAGEAADIEIPGVANGDLAKWIAEHLEFDQLILECYRTGVPDSGWVHVSFKDGHNRKQVLTATATAGGKMNYAAGLHP